MKIEIREYTLVKSILLEFEVEDSKVLTYAMYVWQPVLGGRYIGEIPELNIRVTDSKLNDAIRKAQEEALYHVRVSISPLEAARAAGHRA